MIAPYYSKRWQPQTVSNAQLWDHYRRKRWSQPVDGIPYAGDHPDSDDIEWLQRQLARAPLARAHPVTQIPDP